MKRKKTSIHGIPKSAQKSRKKNHHINPTNKEKKRRKTISIEKIGKTVWKLNLRIRSPDFCRFVCRWWPQPPRCLRTRWSDPWDSCRWCDRADHQRTVWSRSCPFVGALRRWGRQDPQRPGPRARRSRVPRPRALASLAVRCLFRRCNCRWRLTPRPPLPVNGRG